VLGVATAVDNRYTGSRTVALQRIQVELPQEPLTPSVERTAGKARGGEWANDWSGGPRPVELPLPQPLKAKPKWPPYFYGV
jgi:hypothetical protein